jgi:hypothetical protein
LASGVSHIVTLTATVPGGAEYGAAHVLDVSAVSVNAAGNPIAATADDALHLVAYLGDATGNGAYSGLDAQRVARASVGLDTGFAAYPLIDPVVISDVTGNGALSGLDAQRIAQEAVGLAPDEIPPLPQARRLDQSPRVRIVGTSPVVVRSANETFRSRSDQRHTLKPTVELPVVLSGASEPLALDRSAVVGEAVVGIGLDERDRLAILEDVTFEIVDLPDRAFGVTRGQAIQIDIDAAGYGWFIDATPGDNDEFTVAGRHELVTDGDSSAAHRGDLLTVVLHELRHIPGYGHADDGVMDGTLPLGTRRLLPDEFGGLLEGGELGTAAVDQAFGWFETS